MAYNIGLNVVEVDGAGAPALVGAAASIAGFNITTRRGLPNRPARVTTFKQFVNQFGGMFSGSYGGYMVKGFFDNGGQTAYINRVVSSDAASGASPAQLSLNDGAAAPTLTVAAAQSGIVDPGSWGNDLYVKIDLAGNAANRVRETGPATLTGTVLPATTDMTALPPLNVKIDGQGSATSITFANSDFADVTKAKATEMRDAINKRTSLLQASITADQKLSLVSTGQIAHLSKTFTRLEVTAAVAQLGLTAVAANGTSAPITATGTTLARSEDFKPGDAIQISDGASTQVTKVLRVVPDTGAIEWVPAIANAGAFDGTKTVVTALAFNLTVLYGSNDPRSVVETFTGLSMESDSATYAPAAVNSDISGSKYIRLTDLHNASGMGKNVPAPLAITRLTGGSDGTPGVADYTGDPAKNTGFYAFDPAAVQLLTCERTDPAIVVAALGYCANRGDCTYVGSVPMGYVGAKQAVAYGQSFQGKKVYGALYGPWIKVTDPVGVGGSTAKFVPPSGHVMGIYARIESTRGIWKAPAGDEASVVGALDIEVQLSDVDHTDLVKNGSVNGIRAVPGAGIVVDASRTLSTDTRWLYVNVRLLFNYVKSSLKQGLRWVRQEPNRDTLWNAVKFGSVNPFLLGLWRQGAFGTGKPEQVFTVICDASNNPPAQVDQGIFQLEVYFYPSKPAETIVILVGQQPSGASSSES